MGIVADLLTALFLILGMGFLIVGAVGLLRMPDLFTRMHPAGVTDTGAAGLILCGLMFQSGFSIVTVKLVLVLVFLWLTSPTATHAVAVAARHREIHGGAPVGAGEKS
jgi:multicomponent Na+:H+ antiporter subunit G